VTKLVEKYPAAGVVYGLNPFTVIFEAYRAAIYDGKLPNFVGLAVLLGGSFLVLFACIYGFKRLEPAFAKVL